MHSQTLLDGDSREATVVVPTAARLLVGVAILNAVIVWVALGLGMSVRIPWTLCAAILLITLPPLVPFAARHVLLRAAPGAAAIVLAGVFLVQQGFTAVSGRAAVSVLLTAVAVITLGTVHILFGFCRTHPPVRTVRRVLIIGVLLAACACLLDSLTRVESVASWSLALQSGFFTDVALICVCLALWLESIAARMGSSELTGFKIVWIAGAALVIVVAVARISSTVFTYRSVAQFNSEFLAHSQSGIAQALSAEIASAASEYRSLADLRERPAGMRSLQVIADRAVRDNKRHVAYYVGGERVAEAGEPTAAQLVLPLDDMPGFELLWDGSYSLRARLATQDVSGQSGVLEAELPLAITSSVIADLATKLGSAGGVTLCAVRVDPVRCLPSRPDQPMLLIPRARLIAGSALARASAGGTGAISQTRHDGLEVLTAYGSLPGTGLSVFVARDWSSILQPVRRQMLAPLLLLIGTSLLAMLIMRARVLPLVRQLIAARKAAEASEARFIAAAENSPDGFSTFDAVRDEQGQIVDFRLTYQNASAAGFWQVSAANARGQLLSRLLPEAVDGGVMERYRQVIQNGTVIREETPVITPGVQAEWLEHLVVRLGDGIAITFRDITERKKAENRLKHLAQNDALTGLPNRAVFYDRLDHALVRARRTRRPMAVLFLDVDRFKQINDVHGHAAGDALLKKFSERLRRAVRKSDTVARLSGDEFTVILEELHDRADVEKVAGTILRTVKHPLKLADQDVQITASMGVALYSGENVGSAELLDRADIALYAVKRGGRDGYVIYTPEVDTRSQRESSPEIVCMSGTWHALEE